MAAAAKPANVVPAVTADHDATNKPGQPPRNIPKLSTMNIKIQTGAFKARPARMGTQTMLSKLEGLNLVLAIDCETHRLIGDDESLKAWTLSEFGSWTRVTTACIENKRIVQLGWSVGHLIAYGPRTIHHLVKPEGFEICPEASRKHHISHAEAMREGTAVCVIHGIRCCDCSEKKCLTILTRT